MIRLKNISGQIQALHLHEFQIDEIIDVDTSWYISCVIEAISCGNFEVHNDKGVISGLAEQLKHLQGSIIETRVLESNPFATPTHRTKNNATSNIATIIAGEIANIDLLLLQERYVSGGKMFVENCMLGDYITAEVVDKDGVIPEAYKASLCENHPCVNQYVEKMWVNPHGTTILDTRPLTAKISGGLYLRITYHAINEGSARKVAINYDMQKALV